MCVGAVSVLYMHAISVGHRTQYILRTEILVLLAVTGAPWPKKSRAGTCTSVVSGSRSFTMCICSRLICGAVIHLIERRVHVHHVYIHCTQRYQRIFPIAGKSVKSWKRRWFVLKQNGYLYYYTDASARVEKGKIDVVDAANVAPYTAKTKGADPPPATLSTSNAFVIITKDRVFTCVCETGEEFK